MTRVQKIIIIIGVAHICNTTSFKYPVPVIVLALPTVQIETPQCCFAGEIYKEVNLAKFCKTRIPTTSE